MRPAAPRGARRRTPRRARGRRGPAPRPAHPAPRAPPPPPLPAGRVPRRGDRRRAAGEPRPRPGRAAGQATASSRSAPGAAAAAAAPWPAGRPAPPGGLRGAAAANERRGAAEGRAAPAGRYARRRAGSRRPQRGRKCPVKSERPSWKGAGSSGTAMPQDGGRNRRRWGGANGRTGPRPPAAAARGLLGRPAPLPRQRGIPALGARGPSAEPRPRPGPGPAQLRSSQPGLGQARPTALPWPARSPAGPPGLAAFCRGVPGRGLPGQVPRSRRFLQPGRTQALQCGQVPRPSLRQAPPTDLGRRRANT